MSRWTAKGGLEGFLKPVPQPLKRWVARAFFLAYVVVFLSIACVVALVAAIGVEAKYLAEFIVEEWKGMADW